MPRPHKVGIDYFPFDVDLQRDIKLRKPKHKYGYLAVEVYIALLCILYRDKGYYIDYSDPEDVAYLVIDYLQGKYAPEVETVEEITEFLAECELFSGELLRGKNVLSSRRAQRIFYSATADRLQVTVNENIWILTTEEMRELSTRHSLYQNFVNRSNKPVNQSINPQSKVKQSKELLEEEDEARAREFFPGSEDGSPLGDAYDPAAHFAECFGYRLNPSQCHRVEGMVRLHGAEDVFEAIEETGRRDVKYPLAYMEKLMKDWVAERDQKEWEENGCPDE